MANPNGLNPTFVGVTLAKQEIVADDAQSIINCIEISRNTVRVTAVTNDANDFIVLPPLSSVEHGHTIKILAEAGSNFEMRTPASSNEKINNVDSDGSAEYLVTSGDTVIVWKTTNGWVAQSITSLGAVRTAVVPD